MAFIPKEEFEDELNTSLQQLDLDLEDEFDEILIYARQKFRDGAEKHGIFDPDNDADTDRIYEAENELVDNINYSLMQITKLRRLRERIRELEGKVIKLERRANVLRRSNRSCQSKTKSRIHRRTRKRKDNVVSVSH